MKTWILKSHLFLMGLISTTGLSGQDFVGESFISGGIAAFTQADFNNDGKPDLVGISYSLVGPAELKLLINTSDTIIRFEEMTIASSMVMNGSPAVGDFDGDSDLDIAVSFASEKAIMFYINNGDNTFTSEDSGFSGVNILKFLDLEGDGDIDLAGYVNNDNIISTFINDGSGILSLGPKTEHTNEISFVDFGDIDADGDMDLALSVDKFSGETIAIYLNDSVNNFSKLTSFDINALNNAVQVKIIDINRDGKMDICGLNDKRLAAFIQDDLFGFVARDLVDPSNEGDLSQFDVADFDGDGDLDVVIGDLTADLRWYNNVGLIYTQREVSEMQPIFNLLAADFDQDNAMDFVANNGDFRAFRNEIEQMPSSVEYVDIASISMFPNPVQEFLTIDNTNSNATTGQIYDNSGKLLRTEQIRKGKNTFNLGQLEEGIYFLLLNDNHQNILAKSKFIKI